MQVVADLRRESGGSWERNEMVAIASSFLVAVVEALMKFNQGRYTYRYRYDIL